MRIISKTETMEKVTVTPQRARQLLNTIDLEATAGGRTTTSACGTT